MIQVFLECKKAVTSLDHLLPKAVKLTKSEWLELETLHSILQHCYETTTKLQYAEITLSEIYLLFQDNIRHLTQLSELFNLFYFFQRVHMNDIIY